MLSQRHHRRKLIMHNARDRMLALRRVQLLQQCVAVCRSVLQCVASRPLERELALHRMQMLQCVVLQCVLQRVVLLL